MLKYTKVINNQTGLCEVGTGTNAEFYKSIGMSQMNVEISEKDNQWYLSEKCPHYTPEEKEEQEKQRRNQEIDSKIDDLYKMALPDLLQGNAKNIELYKEVIESLANNKEVLNN